MRREPFRLFFPLGLAIAVAGVVPWLAFGRGWIHTWPGVPHSLVMTQGFLVAMAVGFLGTMLPRRTQSAPLSPLELGLLTGGLAVGPAALLAGATVAGEIVLLVALAALGRFAIARFRARPADVTIPASLLFVPQALVHGAIGALLLLRPDEPWMLALGRALAGQGVLFGLVLAVAPILLPIIVHGQPPGASPPGRWRLHALVAIGFSASFASDGSPGLLARGALILLELSLAGVWTPGAPRGLHRALFRLALLLVPIGLVAAGLVPARRVALLHVSYAGGLGLLALATSVHVTVSHTGRAWLADRRPWPVAVAAALIVAAACVRAEMDSAGARYFDALTLAAAMWILGVVVWAGFLVPMLARGRGPVT
jgi:uncharacterized protein involved in response to NO